MLKKINVRSVKPSDVPLLEQLRRQYWDADLEIPKGYVSEGVETAIAEKDGVFLAAMTATQSVVIDPLIRNPEANGTDIVSSVYLLERLLSYLGQRAGAQDSFIAVPSQLLEYHKIVEKAGYQRTCEHCVIFRRPLRPDTEPLLGAERATKANETDVKSTMTE